MDIDPIEVGRRIKAARLIAGFTSRRALADRIFQDTEKKGEKTLHHETVRLWEVGKIMPTWDKIAQLTVLLKIGSEEILFGIRRGAQLRVERPHLAYIEPIETELLTHFRHASTTCQRRIVGLVKNMADDDPASTAEFHNIAKRPP